MEKIRFQKVSNIFQPPTMWLVTYQLKSTHEIYTDKVVNFTDDMKEFLVYLAQSYFDDGDANLISITRI